MSTYSPRTERDVVLECGCVVWGWGQIYIIGAGRKYWTICETHPDGPGKWGLQKVLREAEVSDRILFREYGIPATKRRRRTSRSWLRDLPGNHNNGRTDTKHDDKASRLF